MAMGRAWCLLKSEGSQRRALLAVPTGPRDQVLFNSARIYGPVMLPHLLANWRVVHTDNDVSKYSDACRY